MTFFDAASFHNGKTDYDKTLGCHDIDKEMALNLSFVAKFVLDNCHGLESHTPCTILGILYGI